MPQPHCPATPCKRASSGFSLLELIIVVFIISLLALIAIPLYNVYTLGVSASVGVSSVKMVKFNIAEHYYTNGAFPTSNADISLGTAANTDTYSIAVGNAPSPGSIVLTIHDAPSGANTIVFVPTLADNDVNWDCTQGTLAIDYRPAICQP